MRPSIFSSATAVALLGISFLCVNARAGDDSLAGEWSVKGHHSKLGDYVGWLRITVDDAGVAHVEEASVTRKGAPIALGGSGSAGGGGLCLTLDDTGGLVSGVIGGAAPRAKGVASYAPNGAGGLDGTWTRAGESGVEHLVRAHAPRGLDPQTRMDKATLARDVSAHPEKYDEATNEQRARMIATLEDLEFPLDRPENAITNSLRDDAILKILERTPPLDRFDVLRRLDNIADKDVGNLALYDMTNKKQNAELLAVIDQASAAGDRAGLIEIGIISDIDDTALPTEYQPDGPVAFKGAAEFYRALEFGSDGKGTPGDLHYETARPEFLIANAKSRLTAAGMPLGSFGDGNVFETVFGLRFDGIQSGKIRDGKTWLRTHPRQKFVCLGDTIQRDPEVYRELLKVSPSQIALVLIHKAHGKFRKDAVRDPADYPNEVFFDTYADAMQIARDRGLITPDAKVR